MRNTGDMFDYAINDIGIDGSEFVTLFIQSDYSKRMEIGEPLCIVGKSGIEIALEILGNTDDDLYKRDLNDKYERTPEYWCGWAICYYQWYTSMSYKNIFRYIDYNMIMSLYSTLHEADLSKFVEEVSSRIRLTSYETNLKRIRNTYGCSQSELSRLSGVSLRSIQMYEQRNKDINKAQVDTMRRLAYALGCKMEDLYEFRV